MKVSFNTHTHAYVSHISSYFQVLYKNFYQILSSPNQATLSTHSPTLNQFNNVW